MTSVNLTHVEAQQRSQLIDVDNYDVHLDLTGSETHFTSTTVVTFSAREAGSTFIDLRGESVSELTLDGSALETAGYDPAAGIALNNLTAGAHELKVVAQIPYSRTGEGLHRFVDPADGNVYLYTQFETADAKRAFACFDQPDMKATYDLAFTTPADWKVITNSPVTRQAQGDNVVHRARVDYQLSTYLIALCAGPYHEITDAWTGELTHHPETPAGQPTSIEVPLGLYCRQSVADHLDVERLFTETKQGFDFYHRNFGFAYPFGKYDQIFVPEFNAGAMENAGCVTIRDEYVFTTQASHYLYERRADTILHELAHMWFGDLVTMQWWDDLWLNESFATWAAAISQAEETEYDTAWVTFANVEKSWAYQQDQLPTTHPISTDASDIETVEQNFDGITYAKGASVLKQLQAYVGREEFFAGVRRHFAAHQWSNATFADLLGHLEEASGRDLSFWASQWLKTTGINTLRVVTKEKDGVITSASLLQGGDPLRTHRVGVGVHALVDGAVKRTKRIELDIDGESTEIADLVGLRVEDCEFILPNDEDLTYALLELDERSLEFLINNIDKFEDPMARTLCWSTAWEMTRAGTMRARDFAALVAKGAAAETELAVLERIIMQATTALDAYADPAWAEAEGYAHLAQALLDGTDTDNQQRYIVFANALTKLPLTKATRAFCRDVLENGTDQGLRWKAIAALSADAALPDAPSTIAAELERDKSSTGRSSSLRALAAINTDENKRAVWDEFMGGQLSNLELRHKLEGFTYPGATKHLNGMNEEYFDKAEEIWTSNSSEIAQATINGAFPSWDVSEKALARADKFLERELAGGLRRIVTEQRDRVARALRNRRVDAS
ncbi:aminopeptidase N [Corynebacterium endometrii]|uniref:Aminopeptidase N n=1 Tax=Corynebacterium endometrii TaxID=2488819 RepID=A0A4P7QH82_9CORY|nr:aminopeptidase N [Corynebacterium endometrii]QCB29045.1 Aminopeptidase N [Corynebacterium endometrii]